MLLTRPPLRLRKNRSFFLSSVRLACIRHAASVRPEPGSNSHLEFDRSTPLIVLSSSTFCSRVVRVIAWLLLLLKKRPTHWFVCLLCSVFKGLLLVASLAHLLYHLSNTSSNIFFILSITKFQLCFICNSVIITSDILHVNNILVIYKKYPERKFS